MSNKKTHKKSAMDGEHDPLSWLLQDASDSEEANEINTTCIADDDSEKEDVVMQAETVEENIEDDGADNIIDDSNNKEEKLVLDEDISIVRVAQLKESWLPYIDSTKNITIDASQVEDIDTAGLQLLLSFVKTLKATGREINWHSPSEVFSLAVKETALKDVMGMPCD